MFVLFCKEELQKSIEARYADEFIELNQELIWEPSLRDLSQEIDHGIDDEEPEQIQMGSYPVKCSFSSFSSTGCPLPSLIYDTKRTTKYDI